MSNRKVVITNGNGEEVKTVEIKDSGKDALLDAFDGCWVLSNLGDDETESLEWQLCMAVHHNKRLSHENEALREALRLKEAECEALAHDKSVLLSFVKRVSELDIEDWNYETDDGDGMCFEFIGETEIACDAADLLEDIQSADYYCQCETPNCGAWYQTGKEGDTCKECKVGNLTPQQVEEY